VTTGPYWQEPADYGRSRRPGPDGAARSAAAPAARRAPGSGRGARDGYASPDSDARGTGSPDAGSRSSGSRSSGSRDAGSRRSGSRDAGPRDAGPRSSGSRDAGPRDADPRDYGSRGADPRDDARPPRRPRPDAQPDAAGSGSRHRAPGGAPSAAAERAPRGSRGYPADGARGSRGYSGEQGAGSGQVRQDLRDRLGVRGGGDGRADGATVAGSGSRSGASRGPATSRGNGSGPVGQGRGGQAGRGGADRSGTGRSGSRDRGDYGPRGQSGANYSGGGASGGAAYSGGGYGRSGQRQRPSGYPDQMEPGRDERGRRPAGPGGGSGGRGGGYGGGPGGSGHRSFKQWLLYGSWWRHWTWKKALAVAGGAFLGLIALLVGGFFIALSKTPIPTETTALAAAEPSQVYFSNGKTLIATFNENGVDHQILQANQIPTVMKNAIIAAEDRSFYTEGGISPTGILRAAFVDLKGGSASQGGSTLTEQFVKNYYAGFSGVGNSDKTGSDKIKQMLVAVKLSHTMSKSWILTNYLNTVYFGQSAYGIGAATETYFNEKPAKLTVSQAAMLAALVNSPSGFSTDAKTGGAAYTALVDRWQYVLHNMVRDNVLTQAQVDTMKFPKIHLHFTATAGGWRGYVMEMVKEELEKSYGLTEGQLDGGGFKITTTINRGMMNGLIAAVKANKEAMAEGGVPLPSYAHIGATLVQPKTGAILAFYGGPGVNTLPGKRAVRSCTRNLCDFNMAEAPEPVGSSFKPYVLAEAVKQGMDVQDSTLNGYSPLYIPPDWTVTDRAELSSRTKPADDFGWTPFNEASENTGPTGVAEATAISSDPAYLDLIHRVGVGATISLAGELGVGQNAFNEDNVNDLQVMQKKFKDGDIHAALGEGPLTTVEQADTFATFAADGQYNTAHVVSKIVARTGALVPSKVKRSYPLTAIQAADVDYALSFDNQSTFPGATGFPNAAWDRPVIAKTGTLGNGDFASEAWFNGAIPQYSLSVDLFTDKQSQNIDGLGGIADGLGGTWPAKIWHTFMSTQFADLPVEQLPTPDYTGFNDWNQVTGDGTQLPSPSPTPSNTPSATPTTTPTCTPGIGQACIPSGGTTPSPPVSITPTANPDPSPTISVGVPTPTCTPGPGSPCLPGGGRGGGGGGGGGDGQASSAAVTPAADEATSAATRLRSAQLLVQSLG
jgi:membrane peptidoglycan carboxypeptidase